MRKKKKYVQSSNHAAEQDFRDALKRLLAGQPTNRELQALAVAGKLRISIKAVALEAGRSRTDIAHENCRYPEVRQKILAAMARNRPDEVKTSSVTQKNKDLRRTNRELVATTNLAMSRVAAMLIRMNKLESDYKNKVGEMRRRSRHTEGDQIIGAALQDAAGSDANVVRLDEARVGRAKGNESGEPT